MDLLEIEKNALHGSTMPVGLKFPEQVLFIALRHLHACARAGVLTRDQARAEKLKLLSQFADWMRWDGIYQDTCRMRIELAKVAKDMTASGCPICKKAIAIIDGREKS